MGLGLAFDAAGDLYAALQTTNAIEKFNRRLASALSSRTPV